MWKIVPKKVLASSSASLSLATGGMFRSVVTNNSSRGDSGNSGGGDDGGGEGEEGGGSSLSMLKVQILLRSAVLLRVVTAARGTRDICETVFRIRHVRDTCRIHVGLGVYM